MPIRELVLYHEPILRKKTEPVSLFDRGLHNLLDDMLETMIAERGIGLAAPQIGVAQKIAIIDLGASDVPAPVFSGDEKPKGPEGTLELINPEIISNSGNVKSEEGCLSIPGYRDTIQRKLAVTVSAQDRYGTPFKVSATDLYAFAFQHEIDHLNGILFTDHLSRLKRVLFQRWLEKQDWRK